VVTEFLYISSSPTGSSQQMISTGYKIKIFSFSDSVLHCWVPSTLCMPKYDYWTEKTASLLVKRQQ
jgi:hypothetical protein